ncbi:MAG: hypothetical protein A3F91_09800 [Flavobacteria bacterium RIFCSPLOWO2_12_FULL_35_11]|nr:MAG: hypothetical protein A3F91_09800 [Flavobacteria bacterium RIFCSPLOWO2_12_FULL_35_11]
MSTKIPYKNMKNINLNPRLEKKLGEIKEMGVCEAETFLATIICSQLDAATKHYAAELTKGRIRELNRREAMADHTSEPVTLD